MAYLIESVLMMLARAAKTQGQPAKYFLQARFVASKGESGLLVHLKQ
jgi:hypothetical protein